MSQLIKKLKAYEESDFYPYHMPGHKRNLPGEDVLALAAGLDITEIEGFDNLHDASGILCKLQRQAAQCYGADHTIFSINGSTAGILTAISAAVKKGGTLIMARNCHKAVYHGAYLRGLKPVYLYPKTVPGISIADAVLPEQVKAALETHPEAEAVLITSPSYDGVVADIEKIARIVHEAGIPLIVDGAHGAHFGFHENFPENPLKLGADCVIVSVHKTLPSLTQTALLHMRGDRIDWEKIQKFSRIYQSSSPSYLLMGSIDNCISLLQDKGADLWHDFFEHREQFLKDTEGLKHLRIIARETASLSCGVDLDPGKILISTENSGWNGQQLYDILLERFKLQMEMAAGDYVTAIMTCCDKKEGWKRLAEAVKILDAEDVSLQKELGVRLRYPVLEQALPLSVAMESDTILCSLKEAEGRISGAFVNLYPPGIPLVVPGERFSKEVLDIICECERQKLPLQGLKKGSLEMLELASEEAPTSL